MEKHTPKTRQLIYDNGIYRKTWCGPYAIATVCGTEYEDAYRVARSIRGKRHAKGINISDLEKSCKQLGVTGKWHSVKDTPFGKRTKLARFLPALLPDTVYVLMITKHFLVVDTRDMTTIDSQVPEWIAVEMTKHKTKLVHNYFVVENPKFEPKSKDDWLILPLAAGAA